MGCSSSKGETAYHACNTVLAEPPGGREHEDSSVAEQTQVSGYSESESLSDDLQRTVERMRNTPDDLEIQQRALLDLKDFLVCFQIESAEAEEARRVLQRASGHEAIITAMKNHPRDLKIQFAGCAVISSCLAFTAVTCCTSVDWMRT